MPSGNNFGFDSTDQLPSRSNDVSNIGFLPSSSGSSVDTGGGMGNVDWGSIAGLGAAAASAAFTPNISDRGIIGDVQGSAADLATKGKRLTSEGGIGLEKALKYFADLASGDPSRALAATGPQRGRVIDQYDAARRSASQFTPRGGGQASSEMALRSEEAGKLADTTSAARSEGAKDLASVGSTMVNSGLSAEQQSINAMTQVLGPLIQQQQQQGANTAKTWETIGQIAGMVALAL